MEWVRILLIFIQQLEDAASQRQRLGIFVMRTKYDNLPLQGNNQDIKLAEAHLLLLQEMRSVHEGYDAIELCHSFFLLTQHVECCSEFCLCAQGIGLCRLAYLMANVNQLIRPPHPFQSVILLPRGVNKNLQGIILQSQVFLDGIVVEEALTNGICRVQSDILRSAEQRVDLVTHDSHAVDPCLAQFGSNLAEIADNDRRVENI